MSPLIIGAIVVAVLLVLALGVFMLLVVVGGGLLAFLRSGRPKMPHWQRRLVAKRVNRHLGEKAEEEAVRTVVEAVGYELPV